MGLEGGRTRLVGLEGGIKGASNPLRKWPVYTLKFEGEKQVFKGLTDKKTAHFDTYPQKKANTPLKRSQVVRKNHNSSDLFLAQGVL